MTLVSDYIAAEINCQVVIRDRKVHAVFSRNVEGELRPAQTDHLILDPPAAILFAQTLTDMAFEADTSLKPAGPTLKASLIEQHRARLLPRIATILNSTRENKRLNNQALARELLDVFCREVFI